MKSMNIFALCTVIICSAPKLTLSDEVSEEVKAMYDKADALYERGEYEQASSAYREIMKIKPLWRMYLNIGQCEMKQNRFDLAMEAFQIYLKEGKEKVTEERRDYANKRISEMTPKVGALTFTETETFEIMVNDVKRASTPIDGRLYVMPGEHRVVFEKDGQQVFEKIVIVEAEEVMPIERPKPEPVAPEVAPKPQPATSAVEQPKQQEAAAVEQKRSPLKPIGITLLMAGGATIIPGIITGAMYISDKNSLEKDCPDMDNCSDEGLRTLDGIESFATVTNILLSVGGVSAVTGIVLTVVGHRKSRGDKKDKQLGFAPFMNDHVAGITISGRF